MLSLVHIASFASFRSLSFVHFHLSFFLYPLVRFRVFGLRPSNLGLFGVPFSTACARKKKGKNAILDAKIYENVARIWQNFDKIPASHGTARSQER